MSFRQERLDHLNHDRIRIFALHAPSATAVDAGAGAEPVSVSCAAPVDRDVGRHRDRGADRRRDALATRRQGAAIHLGANEIDAYCVLISFVVTLVVNYAYAARIVYYRRGL